MRIAAILGAILIALPLAVAAQQGPGPAAEADRRAMLDRLAIVETRQGADGFNRNAPNASNQDEAKAGPVAPLPDPLRMADGRKVTSAAMWWRERRPEIVAAFDRDIYGRVPASAPTIAWHQVKEERATEAGMPVIKRWLEGMAGVAPGPSASIQLRYTVPAEAYGQVPVMLSFGFPEGFKFPGPPHPPEPGPDWTEQLLQRGWGYAVVVANSIQADNGGELKTGVIGVSLNGKPRDPEDWGVLRAWAWGASRAREALARDPRVDGRRIGITGHSRWGKAALVAMAYDPDFAIGYISSSGLGGAAPYRRDFGERIGNLAASGEYHWFAGNFLTYAGPLRETDLPIDSNLLIALAAPRPIFLGAGTVAGGDGWVDGKGSFDAAAAAAPVWRLLGKPGLSATDFPPVGTAVVDGTIGYRQHPGGHTPAPNWPTFLDFAGKRLGRAPQTH